MHYVVPAVFVGALFAMQILWTPDESLITSVQGETMGTSWHLKVYDSPIGGNDIRIGLQAEIERINLEMSTYLELRAERKQAQAASWATRFLQPQQLPHLPPRLQQGDDPGRHRPLCGLAHRLHQLRRREVSRLLEEPRRKAREGASGPAHARPLWIKRAPRSRPWRCDLPTETPNPEAAELVKLSRGARNRARGPTPAQAPRFSEPQRSRARVTVKRNRPPTARVITLATGARRNASD